MKKTNESLDLFSDVKITHADRILKVMRNVSKQDLAEYYASISSYILPHIVNRPIVLVRCPDGEKNNCFYQKHYNVSFPKTIYKIDIQEAHSPKEEPYMFIKNLKGLLTLVQFSTLEIHTWGSTIKNIEKADRIVFDLDPGPKVAWKSVIATAILIKERLEILKLRAFVKTTGGNGLHIVVPIRATRDWEEIKAFAKSFAQRMVEENPLFYTTNPLKSKRTSKIFIDYLRNTRGALVVSAYSTRAKPNAPISTPLFWEELKRLKSSDQYTLSNIEQRLSRLAKDPWEEFFLIRQTLPPIK